MERETLDLLKQYAATPGVVGSLGGVAHYFYQVSKGEKFKLTFFIINIFLAGWLSHLLAHFYPYTEFRDSLIGITGFCAYPILKMLEEKFPKFLASKFK